MLQVRVNSIGQLRAICAVYEERGYTNLMPYTDEEIVRLYPCIVIDGTSIKCSSVADRDIKIVEFWEVFKLQLTPAKELKPGESFRCVGTQRVFICGHLYEKIYGMSQGGIMRILDPDEHVEIVKGLGL